MSKRNKVVDFLSEDPEIPHQKFALVSIVGPHMPQKCDTWGLKIRGVADSIDKAKAMTQKLMRIDNDYDIYTVEVGKFFPLAVEPHAVSNVEYQNEQLNNLIKSYLENREAANQEWNKRKNEMIKDAIREGRNQDENKPEHPVAVLQRIRDYEERTVELKETLQSLLDDLDINKRKFESYTDEERALASNELKNAIETVTEGAQDNTLEETRRQLMNDLENVEEQPAEDNAVSHFLSEIKEYEQELDELRVFKASIDPNASPSVYKRTIQNISSTEKKLEDLKSKLNNAELVNKFINSQYTSSQYDYLEDNARV